MKKNILLLVIASVFIFTQFVNGQVNEQDSLALVDLYNSTNGSNWDKNSNWLTKNKVASWYGITVSNKHVTKITLDHNKLTDSIPSSIGDFTELTHLYLSGNNLSGEIPSSIGNLTVLTHLDLWGYNSSGKIPSSIGNLTALIYLDLHSNNLSVIPSSIGNLTALTYLDLHSNNLSGEIPSSIGNLTALTDLTLSSNTFSGEIPSFIGNLTALKILYLHHNNFSGEIPSSIGNLTLLKTLDFTENNLSGEIPSSFGNLTNVEYIRLDFNNISGSIPSSIGNLNNLAVFSLNNNNITNIPTKINDCSKLYSLDLSNNNLNDLPAISLDLRFLEVDHNYLNYTSLEKQSSLNIFNKWAFKFVPQRDSFELQCQAIGDSIEFTFEQPGGANTVYKWLKKNKYGKYREFASTTSNNIKISKQENIKDYACETFNTVLRYLYFTGYPPECSFEEKDCWQAGQLTFCVHSGKWEKGGTNKIKTTNTLSINDFLYFDGTMTIDTAALEIEASGEFYVDNIPLAQNLGIGKYTLAEGKYKLNLNGDEQKITNFLNSELSKTAMIFGTPVKIDDLHFFKQNDTIGININASVSVPWLSTGCCIPGIYNPKTDLKLKRFEITNKGILSAGFQVENFGLFSLGCLKNATLEYNWKKDILIGGAELSLPYFDGVGAGVKIEGGIVDSIEWKIDSDSPLIPIYATFSAKGFYGHIAGLNNYDEYGNANLNKIDIKIGGIFTDKLAKQIYQLDMDGRIKLSGLFEASGKVQFLQPPVDNFPYQIQGKGKMTWNYPNKQLKFDFNGNFGTLNEKEWIGDAIGNISVDYRDEIPKLSAYFDGNFTLPRISDEWPLNMISITMGTTNRIFNDSPNLVHGIMYQYLTAETFCELPCAKSAGRLKYQTA